ncbi:hypothetical protein M758_2G045100 [Ceratodon purpureus]|nr:hypothetical protein M758_2G045100 [Ceratodon purpureus]
MSDAEEGGEGEEGEEKKEEPAAPKPPSKVQIKLAEQGKYVAGKLDLIFSTLLKIEGDIVKVHETIIAGDEAIKKEFNDKLSFLSNRVLTIEKERAEEKAAAEAARRAALGLPPEEIDPFEKFNKLHTDLAGLVRSNPSMLDNAVVKLEETLSSLGPGEVPLEEASEAPAEEAAEA